MLNNCENLNQVVMNLSGKTVSVSSLAEIEIPEVIYNFSMDLNESGYVLCTNNSQEILMTISKESVRNIELGGFADFHEIIFTLTNDVIIIITQL